MSEPESNEVVLVHYKGVVFENITIDLDGHCFEDCAFVNCTIRYRGNPYRLLGGWRRQNVNWEFHDAARRTIQILRHIGSGDRSLFQNLFPDIFPPH